MENSSDLKPTGLWILASDFNFLLSCQVYLLNVNSQYVLHLAGNVLLVVSEFVATFVCYDSLS